MRACGRMFRLIGFGKCVGLSEFILKDELEQVELCDAIVFWHNGITNSHTMDVRKV